VSSEREQHLTSVAVAYLDTVSVFTAHTQVESIAGRWQDEMSYSHSHGSILTSAFPSSTFERIRYTYTVVGFLLASAGVKFQPYAPTHSNKHSAYHVVQSFPIGSKESGYLIAHGARILHRNALLFCSTSSTMAISGYASPSAVIGIAITFTILAGITVLLRLFTRLRIVNQAGLDDYFIGNAWVRVHKPNITRLRANNRRRSTASG